MFSKNLLFLLLATIGGSAQAISFMDYYKGNAALGIPSHEKSVNDQVENRRLYIVDAHLTDLEGIDTVPNIELLQDLHVNHNQLEKIPNSIIKLSRLQDLRIHNNQFSEFPAVICKLPQLQQLDLEYNQLTNIPECIGNLPKLARLYLGYNQLTSLPQTICKLIELHDLFLADNGLNEIPDCLGKLIKSATADFEWE